ncbi:membrane protein insertion efficiency factor YidD [Bacteroidota bacterium]
MKSFIIISFLLINFFIALSQSEYELNKLQAINDIEETGTFEFARNSSNELEFVFSGLFLFYKRFISSQDVSRCNFTPSCSEYALQAIKSQGTIIGITNFFDRFTRCNGLNKEDYPKDSKNKVLIDPVRNSKYEITF